MLTKRNGDPQNWSDTYHAGPLGRWKTIYEVQTAFDFLLIISVLGILVAAIRIRKHGLNQPFILFKPFIASIVLYMISHLLSAIVSCIYLTDATVKMAFKLALIIQEFSYLCALCTILYLFYRLLFRFQERSTGRVSGGLMLVHGTIIGLMILICIAEFSTYVFNIVKDYEVSLNLRSALHWIQVIQPLYVWLASLEIMIWGIFLVVRTSRIDRKAKPSASSLLLGTIGFFAMNLMWAIITIQWDVIAYFGYGGTPFPQWIRYVEIIFPVFCIIVTYIGILLCCTRLAGLDDSNIFPADVPSSYSVMTYHNSHSNTLDMESRPMITEADPSRELWEAGSRSIHEADAAYSLRAWKP